MLREDRTRWSPVLWKVIRAVALIALDTTVWVTAFGIAVTVRHEFDFAAIDPGGLVTVIAIAVGLQLVWGLATGLYPGRWELASFHEAGMLGLGGMIIAATLMPWVWQQDDGRMVPLSTSLAAPMLFVVGALGARFLVRLAREVRSVSHHRRTSRALVFGAGEAGHETIAALLRDSDAEILPVACLDDDPTKTRLRVRGRRVVGGREHIATAAKHHHADTLLIAMPSAPRATIAEISRLARQAGLRVLILPRIARFLSPDSVTASIRPISYTDLLGRDPVHLDLAGLERFLDGKTVLITGAGGSIGSELAVAVTRLNPGRLVLLDRDENALHALQLRLEGRALLDADSLVVADIRDARTLDQVFAQHCPDIVFHAAALKHVTFLERFPSEAVKTNVFGTANLLEMAALHKVERFVNISTDKAADPISVLGITKRIGEMLVAGHALNGTTGMSVRFGNVLGSAGSVIPTFQEQIRRGGPITITHPDVTRYFMTIQEAAYLVIQAAVLGRKGEVLVLEMGKPVRIADLAHNLVEEIDPGADIAVEYTGLRPGEKLHEVLVGERDRFTGRPHEGINSYAVPSLDTTVVEGLDPDDPHTLRRRLEWIVRSTIETDASLHELV